MGTLENENCHKMEFRSEKCYTSKKKKDHEGNFFVASLTFFIYEVLFCKDVLLCCRWINGVGISSLGTRILL